MASRPSSTTGGSAFTWYYFRVSGVLLLVLALGHLGIMHIVADVGRIDFQFVAERMRWPFWRGYDLLLLWLALTHGLLGVRLMADEYLASPGWHAAAVRLIRGVGALGLALGSWVILTF